MPMDENYTNERLATEYDSLNRIFEWNKGKKGDYVTKLIRDAATSIPFYYSNIGFLRTLTINNIGLKTKEVLELILEKGVDEAREILRKERDRKTRSENIYKKFKIREDFYRELSDEPKSPKRGYKDSNPSWKMQLGKLREISFILYKNG